MSWQDIFSLQDHLVKGIVSAMAPRLSATEARRLKQDVPASPEAFDLYLRANELSGDRTQLEAARDLYQRCLEIDSGYAPAWARLGRIRRLIGKYGRGASNALREAEAALRRALELNPELGIAHAYYAQLEADLGQSREALARLLDRAQMTPNSADIFAGLVHACRFCGLLQESLAAHQRARRLDPTLSTSVTQTHYCLGHYRECVETGVGAEYIAVVALVDLGRREEALIRLDTRPALPPLTLSYKPAVRSGPIYPLANLPSSVSTRAMPLSSTVGRSRSGHTGEVSVSRLRRRL